MLRRFVYPVGLVLLFAAVSQAAIMPILIKEVNPGDQSGAYAGFNRNLTTNPAGPFAVDTAYNSGTLASTWVSYSLALQATAGEKISAIAANISATVSPTAGYNQRWNFNADTGEFNATPESTSAAAVTNPDSHIIRLGGVVGAAAAENNNQPGGPPTAPDNATQDYGVGSSLTAQFGFNAAEQASLAGTVVKFAYLVIPRGFEPTVTLTAGIAFN